MIDSVGKKIDFIRDIIKKISLSAKTEKKRIENLNIGKADMIVSRALAPLNKLLSYSLFLSNKNTTCLFLKGRSVYNEIEMAKKNFFFNYETFKSISSEEGHVLKITNLNAKKMTKIISIANQKGGWKNHNNNQSCNIPLCY